MKKMNTEQDAYFTLEASLIIPLVILFITAMIFMTFYSYDRCVMETAAYEAALQGTSNHIKDANEAAKVSEEAAEFLVSDKLFAIRDVTYKVDVDANKVTVTYTGTVNMPCITWLVEHVGNVDMSLSISRSANRCYQTKTIRTCRVINKLIEK